MHEPQARPGAGVISCMLMLCFAPVVRASNLRLRAHVRQHLRNLGARNALDVVLIFKQHAQRVVHQRSIQRDCVQLMQRAGPIQRLCHARLLEQILRPQILHEFDDLAGQAFGRVRRLGAHDLRFAL